MKVLLTLLVFLSSQLIEAQSTRNTQVIFVPTYDEKPLYLNTAYGQDSLKIEQLKFYISPLVLANNEDKIVQESSSYHLLDLEYPESLKLSLTSDESATFTHLEFDLGVDSLNNVSGAMEGDLDPMHGMYWTWQSGYINFKLEGTSLKCPARKNEFQFHLGGYQSPCYSMQHLSLPVSETDEIIIEIAVDKFLKQINLEENNHVMSPNKDALEMSKTLAGFFEVKKNNP